MLRKRGFTGSPPIHGFNEERSGSAHLRCEKDRLLKPISGPWFFVSSFIHLLSPLAVHFHMHRVCSQPKLLHLLSLSSAVVEELLPKKLACLNGDQRQGK